MSASSATPGGFDFAPRTRLVFGSGAVARAGALARELGAVRVLVVCDAGVAAAGHLDPLLARLGEAGCTPVPYTEVESDPDAEDASRCAGAIGVYRPELVLALGGGSAIDTAKGGAILAANGGHMRDYRGHGKTRAPLLPLIAVPTTAGTGSEVQSYALIADETGQKMACGADDVAPRIALLDPELTLTCPRDVSALAGLDALGHALETAVSRKRTELSALFSRAAFAALAPAFARVLAAGEDREARAAMLLGAAWAGLAIEHSMLGAAHSLANPLSRRLGLAHGLAVGLALPAVVRFNAADPVARERYAALARAGGLAGPAEDAGRALERLSAFLDASLAAAGIARNAAAHGARAADFPALAAEAGQQWTAQFNPVPVGPGDLERLLAATFGPA